MNGEKEWFLQTLAASQLEISNQLKLITKYFSQPVKLAISTEQISGYLAITNNLVVSGEMVLKKGKLRISMNKELPYSIIQIENVMKYIIMAQETLTSQNFVIALEQIDKMSRMIRRTRQQLYSKDPLSSYMFSVARQDSVVEKDNFVDINLNQTKLRLNIYHFKKIPLINTKPEEYEDAFKIFRKTLAYTKHHNLPEIEDCIEIEIEHPPMKQIMERIYIVEQLIRECVYNLQCFKN